MILYTVFNVWPIVRGFAMAFTDYRFLIPGSMWAWNGLDNYVEMFQDKMFWHSFVVSLKFTAMTFPPGLILSLTAAVLISQIHWGAGFFRWVIYLPVITPVSVAMLMWGQLLGYKFGYINVMLRSLGVEDPPNWLGDVSTALVSVAVADVWNRYGFATMLFLIGIYGINRELYEAAAMDGAGWWTQLLRITLPLLRPVFVLILVLNAGVVGATEQMLILTDGGPQNSTLTTGLYLYRQGFQFGDLRLGYAAAMSLFLGSIHMGLSALVFYCLRTERA